MSMYADNTELHHDLSSVVQHALQCNLGAIQAWLYINQLQLMYPVSCDADWD